MKPHTRLVALLSTVAACLGGQTIASAGDVGFPQYPALSPDGERLLFSWAGDLWEAAATGGEAKRLTAHPAEELASAFSPDGKWIAFESKRTGYQHLFIADRDFSEIRQLYFDDRPAKLCGFTVDSSQVIFTSPLAHLIPKEWQIYTVPVVGGPRTWMLDCLARNASQSPDGQQTVFVRGYNDWDRRGYRGSGALNVWLHDDATGDYTQLTTRDGNDGQPKFLPDGSILFLSDRDNIVNVWKLPANPDASSRPVQLTYFEEDDVRDLAVSADGSLAAFVVWDRIYTLDLTSEDASARAIALSTPTDLSIPLEREVNVSSEVSDLALSPDGKTYAFVARGEVFIKAVEGDRPVRRVTDTPWRESDIVWAADGEKLYFTSDSNGSADIYAATVALDEIDVKGEKEEAEAPAKEEEPEEPAEEVEEAEGEAGAEAEVAETADEPDAEAEVAEESAEEEAEAEPDKPRRKQWDRSLRFDIETVLETEAMEGLLAPSPDGTKLAFRRDLGDLVILDLETGEETILLEYWNLDSFEWSADSQLIVFVREDMDYNSDIWIMPADGSREAVNISRSPDNDYQAHLSADNKILAFTSDREEKDDFDVFAVYLDKSLESLPDYELKEYYDEAVKAAKKRKPIDPDAAEEEEADADDDAEAEAEAGAEVEETDAEAEEADAEEEVHPFDELDLDDAYLRLRRLTRLPGSEMNVTLTPGGDRVLFTASVDGSPGLYSVKWDGSDRERIDTGGAGDVEIDLTGSTVTFVRGGSPRTAKPTGGAEGISFRASIRVNQPAEQKQKFLEAARALGTIFYHPTMKGRDWQGLTEKYLGVAVKTRSETAFNRVVNMFIGELDASHLGIYGPNSEAQWRRPVGYFGAEYDVTPEGYRITTIYTDGPLDQGAEGPQVGDLIVEVNGIAVPGDMTLEQAMVGMVREQSLLTLIPAEPDEDAEEDAEPFKYVLADPIGYRTQDALAYAAEVKRRGEAVKALSNGRLGYIHIESMSEPSLKRFERDLYAVAHDKDGLVIDVRSNGGGWINDILLTSLMVEPHAFTLPRITDRSSREHYPQDRRLIYAYSKPIVVLCNEQSFSNAEIFAHAIKTLGRGTLVGMPTFGGVISTGGMSLIDGTFFRLPLRGWYLLDGTDMELHGAVPDIMVPMNPWDEAQGNDPQLQAAIDDLMKRLD